VAATTTSVEPDAMTVGAPTFLTRRELVVLSVALATVLGALLLLVLTGAHVAAALSRPS